MMQKGDGSRVWVLGRTTTFPVYWSTEAPVCTRAARPHGWSPPGRLSEAWKGHTALGGRQGVHIKASQN